jgi:hypothetical protein
MTQKAKPLSKDFTAQPVATLSKMYFHGLYEADQKTPLSSFQLVPINSSCPFSRAVYDPSTKSLIISGTITQEYYEKVQKLDSNGQPMTKKFNGSYQNVLERIRMNRVIETTLSTKEDILDFVSKTVGSYVFADGVSLVDHFEKLDNYTHVENPR